MKCQWAIKGVSEAQWSSQGNGSQRYLQLWPKEDRWPGIVSLSGQCFPQLASTPSLKHIITSKISIKGELMHMNLFLLPYFGFTREKYHVHIYAPK